MTIPNWAIYQTLDNTWDGPRDSTVCIDAEYVSYRLRFNSAQLDASRPVFIKANIDTIAPIEPNTLWKYALNFPNSNILVDNVDYCNDGFCSGMLLEVDVPMTDTTFITREYVANYDGTGYDADVEMCVTYEYPEFSKLRNFVIKLVVEENSIIDVYSPDYQNMMWAAVYLDSVNILDFGNGNPYYIFEDWEHNNIVVPYNQEDGFPSQDAISYFDIYPVPNVVEQTEIIVYLYSQTSLIFEPFTNLRPGLCEGSDSLRHELTIENNGAELCMIPYIDVVMLPSMSYVHKSGKINFSHKSCIRFKFDSDLIVAESSHFVCGTLGEGFIAFDDGSRVTVESNATMTVNNGIVLFDSPWLHGEQWTEIDVFEGGKIIFEDGAYVDSHVADKRFKCLIRLHGGSADLSGLSPEDRAYFVVVGKDAEVDSHELVILGNPAKNVVNFEFNTYELGEWQLEVLDNMGKLHLRESLVLETSKNNRSLDVEKLPAGMYFLSLTKDGQKVQQRVLIAE